MSKNYDIELSSNDSDNDSDSNETLTGGDKYSKAKIKVFAKKIFSILTVNYFFSI